MTQAYPLQWPEGWPRTKPDHRKVGSQFKTTFLKARTDLFDELDRLGASGAVVSSWLQLTNAGLPRGDVARMRIDDPGVAVYFQYRGRPMVIARDSYWTVHDNLRSIGLAISHLRGLERHGGGHMMDRAFTGFAQIGAQAQWREILGFKPGDTITKEQVEASFRALARAAHPDAGGTHDQMAKLNQAADAARRELAA